MVPFDNTDFPNNVVVVLIPKLIAIPGVDLVVARPLWDVDPDCSIGITAVQADPEQSTMEMGHPYNTAEPTLTTYTYAIQGLIRHTDQVDGLAAHSWLSKRIRSMVYRNPSTQLALRALSVTDGLVTERIQRYGVRAQRFLTNEVGGSFLYMSTLEMFVETETVS